MECQRAQHEAHAGSVPVEQLRSPLANSRAARRLRTTRSASPGDNAVVDDPGLRLSLPKRPLPNGPVSHWAVLSWIRDAGTREQFCREALVRRGLRPNGLRLHSRDLISRDVAVWPIGTAFAMVGSAHGAHCDEDPNRHHRNATRHPREPYPAAPAGIAGHTSSKGQRPPTVQHPEHRERSFAR